MSSKANPLNRIGSIVQSRSFPYAKPTWPSSVQQEHVQSKLGINYDSEWSRKYPARLVRAAFVDWVAKPAIELIAPPSIDGLDRIEQLHPPIIFAANHSSHLDTVVLMTSLPNRLRHRTVVAAGADYFFDKTWKAHLWSLTTAAIPIERTKVNRQSAIKAIELLRANWNLLIYPEGGRSPDGWGQPFRPGASYLASRTSAPVVPVYISGTREVMAKDAKKIRQGATRVVFGSPLYFREDEDVRAFSARIEGKVAELADESSSDWWQAKKNAGTNSTPPLTGPIGSKWRREWELKNLG